MASRNADRLSVRDWRAKAETVAQMRALRWQVVAKCQACRTELAVDLARVERARGPSFSLWDVETSCRRRGCAGRMMFLAMGPGMAFFEALTGHAAPQPPAWRRNRD